MQRKARAAEEICAMIDELLVRANGRERARTYVLATAAVILSAQQSGQHAAYFRQEGLRALYGARRPSADSAFLDRLAWAGLAGA